MSSLTHFLCLPLVNERSRPQLKASLSAFQQEVCSTENGNEHISLPAAAIRPVGTIHLTLGVMALSRPGRLEAAIKHLSTLDLRELLGTSSESSSALVVDLISLHAMHSPTSTSVLYASPHDSTNKLLPIANKLRTMFMEAGLLVSETRPLKLHATIVNTVYVKGRDTPNGDSGRSVEPSFKHGKKKRPAPVKLDARPLIERYKDQRWATDVLIDRIAICEMGAKPVLDESGKTVDQAYKEVASLSLQTPS